MYQKAEEWVCTRLHCCQLIRHINKRKRLAWCKEDLKSIHGFADIIYSECSAWTTCKVMFCKRKQPRKLKQKSKHSPKLHIYGEQYHFMEHLKLSSSLKTWMDCTTWLSTTLNWHPLEYTCRDVCTSSLNNDPSTWLCTIVIIMHAKLSASVHDTQLYLHFPTPITSPIQI